MKKWMMALFCMFLISVAQSEDTVADELDFAATANAKWKVGEVVYEELTDVETFSMTHRRYFLGVTSKGLYRVYDKTQKVIKPKYQEALKDIPGAFLDVESEPYTLIGADSVTSAYPLYQGYYISRYSEGGKYTECEYENGSTLQKPCQSWYKNGDLNAEIWYVGGRLQKLVSYYNGIVTAYMYDLETGRILNVKNWDEHGNLVYDGPFIEN